MLKTALFITSLLSAIIFATMCATPPTDPHSAPKAWAHGVGFVLPRLLGTLAFAWVASILARVEMRRKGVRQTIRHPAVIVSFALLLPAAYIALHLFLLAAVLVSALIL